MASFPFSRSLLFLLCFANCHCQDAEPSPFSHPPTSRPATVLEKSRFACKTRSLPRSTRRCILQLQHPYIAGLETARLSMPFAFLRSKADLHFTVGVSFPERSWETSNLTQRLRVNHRSIAVAHFSAQSVRFLSYFFCSRSFFPFAYCSFPPLLSVCGSQPESRVFRCDEVKFRSDLRRRRCAVLPLAEKPSNGMGLRRPIAQPRSTTPGVRFSRTALVIVWGGTGWRLPLLVSHPRFHPNTTGN
uniref:Putative secreted protein n=1 Tax=Anopheles darlingi TaxID=43151 RepID=A0A2M4CZW4_ANODA